MSCAQLVARISVKQKRNKVASSSLGIISIRIPEENMIAIPQTNHKSMHLDQGQKNSTSNKERENGEMDRSRKV
jgi:hypothetical protein